MNPLQTVAILVFCSAVITVKMSLLMSQGISLLMALLVVYLFAVFFMMGLQFRARQSCESLQNPQTKNVLPEQMRSSRTVRLTLV